MFITAVCVIFLIKLRWPKEQEFIKFQQLAVLICFPEMPSEGQFSGTQSIYLLLNHKYRASDNNGVHG